MEMAERATQACLVKANTVLGNQRKTQNERNEEAEPHSIVDSLRSWSRDALESTYRFDNISFEWTPLAILAHKPVHEHTPSNKSRFSPERHHVKQLCLSVDVCPLS